MNKEELIKRVSNYINESPENIIQKEYAISQDLVGMRMFGEPLIAFSLAEDPLFEELKAPEAMGPHHLMPAEWLPGAKTVISVFLPFTSEVKKSNRTDAKLPSAPWLHARIEGHKFINNITLYIKELLEKSGDQAVVPLLDKRFWAKAGKVTANYPHTPETDANFISNWSERHVGFICGHGTFGLSRGLITQKGVAGRMGSVITDAHFEPTKRAYTGLYEYCSKCGACIRRCPASAISLEKGKEHPPCSDYLDEMLELYRPRYACGKCQAGVPCESGIPQNKY